MFSSVQFSSVRNVCLKKVLIATLYAHGGNLGNALQHYALQEKIKSYGFETASFICPENKLSSRSIFALKILHCYRNLKDKIKRIAKLILALPELQKHCPSNSKKISNEAGNKRMKIFEEFYDKFIDSKIHTTYSEVLNSSKSQWQDYSCAVAGSDQIWNLGILTVYEALRFFFLEFVERDKRVNYASSFGMDKIKFIHRRVFRKGLKGFKKLSCREKSGCELIKQLTGREAEHVLDPTLLLTDEQWRKIERKPSFDLPEHYILSYSFSDYSKYYEDFSDMKIIDIFNPEKYPEYFNIGPCEFLWLVDHADFVFTASFHGTIFSINFRKNFISFAGTGTSGRIENFLSILGLSERIYKPGQEIPKSSIDYGPVYEKINSMRESSMKYLRGCLK